MNRKALQSIINALAAEKEVDSITLVLGASIEALAFVTNPETAAEICGKAQTMLLDRGSLA